jgi:hypothetical protein
VILLTRFVISLPKLTRDRNLAFVRGLYRIALSLQGFFGGFSCFLGKLLYIFARLNRPREKRHATQDCSTNRRWLGRLQETARTIQTELALLYQASRTVRLPIFPVCSKSNWFSARHRRKFSSSDFPTKRKLPCAKNGMFRKCSGASFGKNIPYNSHKAVPQGTAFYLTPHHHSRTLLIGNRTGGDDVFRWTKMWLHLRPLDCWDC